MRQTIYRDGRTEAAALDLWYEPLTNIKVEVLMLQRRLLGSMTTTWSPSIRTLFRK